MKLNDILSGVAIFLSATALGLSGFLFYHFQNDFLPEKDHLSQISEKLEKLEKAETPENFQKKVEKAIKVFIAKNDAEARAKQAEENTPKKVDFEISADDDPVLGDPDAPVTIVEFSDYECPFCGRHFRQVLPKIIKEYVDTGKVKIVFRDFPLSFHPDAMPAAVAANCARELSGSDKIYFQFHDKLFENQKNLTRENFIKYAEDLGLDKNKFAACLDKNDTAEIKADIADGQKYGVSGTPGFFINGTAVKGAYPLETFKEIIDGELAK